MGKVVITFTIKYGGLKTAARNRFFAHYFFALPVTERNGDSQKRKTFRYSPKNGEFTLHIDFKKLDNLSQNTVLKALKETFDLVKNEEIDL